MYSCSCLRSSYHVLCLSTYPSVYLFISLAVTVSIPLSFRRSCDDLLSLIYGHCLCPSLVPMIVRWLTDIDHHLYEGEENDRGQRENLGSARHGEESSQLSKTASTKKMASQGTETAGIPSDGAPSGCKWGTAQLKIAAVVAGAVVVAVAAAAVQVVHLTLCIEAIFTSQWRHPKQSQIEKVHLCV